MFVDKSTVEPLSWLIGQLGPLVRAQGWALEFGEPNIEYLKTKPTLVLTWNESSFDLQLRKHNDAHPQVATESFECTWTLWAPPPLAFDTLWAMRSFLLTYLHGRRSNIGVSTNMGALKPAPIEREMNGMLLEWDMTFDFTIPLFETLTYGTVNDVDPQFNNVNGDGEIGSPT